mgnify:CR=1 FL=1|jgi:hypothetical protein
MMHSLRRLRLHLLALLCLAAGQSWAAVSVVHTDASAAPSAIALSTVTFDIGTDYPFNTLDVLMFYDSNLLTFQPDMSTVTIGSASAIGLNNFIAALQTATAGNFVPNFGTPGIYGFTTSITPGQTPILVSGPVTVSAAFLLSGNLSGPAFVDYEGAISGAEEHLFGNTITITAVPEPETWLLWAAGLGLLGRFSRRRLTPRQPAPRPAR